MERWFKHSIAVVAVMAAGQLVLHLAPSWILNELIIAIATSNWLSLGYALFAFYLYDQASQGLRTVLGTKAAKVVEASWSKLTEVQREGVMRKVELLVAYAMAYVDRMADLGDEEFGVLVGKTLARRLDVQPESAERKIQLVTGE